MNTDHACRFVWTDLSTFDVPEARRFYSSVFGWKYADQDGYLLARKRRKLVSGLFLMPEFLQEIGMPSFWMSYLSVDDADAAVARAKAHDGAIIEIEPFDFGTGRAALIRDPAGAGFTIYEGSELDARGTRTGELIWNDLVTADVETVRPFYSDVVGLSFVESAGGRHRAINAAGEHVADVQELAEDLRGDKVYWLPYFGVANVDRFAGSARSAGGSVLWQSTSPEGETGLFTDTQDAAFAVVGL